jgi:hypothetical protein
MIPKQYTHSLQMCHYMISLLTRYYMLRLRLAIFIKHRHKGMCIFLKLANLSRNVYDCI